MTIFWSLLRKELIDAIRDKRSVMAGLYYAILTPVFTAALFILMIDKFSGVEDVLITMTNAEQAPHLVAHLNREGVLHSDDDAKKVAIELIIGAE